MGFEGVWSIKALVEKEKAPERGFSLVSSLKLTLILNVLLNESFNVFFITNNL